MDAMAFELEIVAGRDPGRRIPLPRAGRLAIGRSPPCEIVLEDERIAPLHARIEIRDAEVNISDLGGGVLLEGKRVGRSTLEPDQRFELGGHVLALRRGGSMSAPAAAPEEATVVEPRRASATPRSPGPAKPAETRRAIGPYEIQDRLGDGGQASVYLGRHAGGGAFVAVKVLRTDFRGDEEMVGRFEREIRLSSQLEHPNIVRFLDAGRDGSLLYLVTEYVPGIPGRQIVGAGPVEIERALRWGRDIASALVHAHEMRILHRDLKPDNLIVERETDRIRILDFGLGRVLDDEEARLTFTGQKMGTIQYASPEQFFDAKAVDVRTDVYGLGACLYAFLTGRPPVASLQVLQAWRDRPGCTAEPIRRFRPEVPDRVVAAIEKALSRDPDRRFASAAEMLAALR